MELKLLERKSIRVNKAYRHGFTEQEIYACPCGKGIVLYEEDDIIGQRDWYTQIKCEECNKKYKIENYISRNWTIVEKI